MDDARLIEEGLAGRLAAESAEFERFVDITARRPSGAAGAAHYRDPKEHEQSFAIALAALELTAADRCLELCFGGGQLLERALEGVASAAGIDHSPEAPNGRFVLVTARSRADPSAGPWNPALRRYEQSVLRAMLLDAGFTEARVDEMTTTRRSRSLVPDAAAQCPGNQSSPQRTRVGWGNRAYASDGFVVAVSTPTS